MERKTLHKKDGRRLMLIFAGKENIEDATEPITLMDRLQLAFLEDEENNTIL